MYWLISFDPLAILLFFLQSLIWMLGGWLIVTHAFKSRSSERLITGVATGFLLFIGFSNLFSHWVSITIAFWLSSLFILAMGIVFIWKSGQRPWLDRKDLKSWPHCLALGLLTWFFFSIQLGLGLFDDFEQLPMISIMGAGDIPPHFYLDPDFYFAYHYGLQVWAASLINQVKLLPWSAWDLTKAVAIAFTLVLGWVYVKRLTRNSLAAWLGTVLLTFASGTRWLFLFLPYSTLIQIQEHLKLVNSATDIGNEFASVIVSPMAMAGQGLVPFPFAYHNGIFTPVISVLGHSGAIPYVIALVLLLLVPGSHINFPAMLVLSMIFGVMALGAENMFTFIWIALFIILLVVIIRNRKSVSYIPPHRLLYWAGVLVISAVLSAFQGGFITETVRGILAGLIGGAATQSSNVYEFSLRWPPGLYTAHLGVLSLFKPLEILTLVIELGPVLLLGPMAIYYSIRSIKRGAWLPASLGIGGALLILFPFFVAYGVDRSTTRLPATGLWLWLAILTPLLWQMMKTRGRIFRDMLIVFYFVTVFGAVNIFSVQMTTMPNPQNSYFINPADARFARSYYNKFPSDIQILDRIPYRAVTIFGRAVKAYESVYDPLPGWPALIENPDPEMVYAAGFQYIYMDEIWWATVPQETRDELEYGCATYVGTPEYYQSTSRWLIDLSNCH
ncbi:MAG: hypothetical protein JW704_04710 [Anaerolineaceae bacterium]|nr:hypothetical protein [Anaerolineaceae bacterium]MBN2676980.1 hypothetical protein [Anaerolineaceae bacterium]